MSSTTKNVLISIPEPKTDGTSDIKGYEKYIIVDGTAFPQIDVSIQNTGAGPAASKNCNFSNVSYSINDADAIKNGLAKIITDRKPIEKVIVVLVNAPENGNVLKLQEITYYKVMLTGDLNGIDDGKIRNLEINAAFVKIGTYQRMEKSSQLLNEIHCDVNKGLMITDAEAAAKAIK